MLFFGSKEETETKLERDMKQMSINPIALRKAKIVYNFGLSECKRVKSSYYCTYECNSVSHWIKICDYIISYLRTVFVTYICHSLFITSFSNFLDKGFDKPKH